MSPRRTSVRHRPGAAALVLAGPVALLTSALLAAPAAHGAASDPHAGSVPSASGSEEPTVSPSGTPTVVVPGPSCHANVSVVRSWPDGYQAEVVVTGGPHGTGGWRVTVSGGTVTQAWNARQSGNVLTNAAWNGPILPWATRTAGFLGSGSPDGLVVWCTARTTAE